MRKRATFLDPVDLQVFLSAWTEFDPVGAMSELDRWPSATGREIGMRIVMREWAGSGRVLEAANYYQTLENPETKTLVAGPLIRGWALSGDSGGALERVRLFWDQGEPVDMVDGFVRGALQSEGSERLLERVVSLEPNRGGEFEQRLARVALNLSAHDNPVAAGKAYASLEAGLTSPWLHGALANIAGPRAATNPVAAIEWLLERTESRERVVALKGVVRAWAIRDMDGAWGWWSDRASRLGAGPDLTEHRSILLPPLLRRMAQVRPREASKWVAQVEKSSTRETLILRVAAFWAARNRREAEQWVGRLGLAADFLVQVEQAIERAAGSAASAPPSTEPHQEN